MEDIYSSLILITNGKHEKIQNQSESNTHTPLPPLPLRGRVRRSLGVTKSPGSEGQFE